MNNSWLIFFIIVGVLLTIFGGRILFSDKALDKMYEKGWWRRDIAVEEKRNRQYDRYGRGGSIFILGLILIVGSIVAFFL